MKILVAITLLLFTFGQLGRITPFEIPAFSNLYEIGLFSIGIYLFTKYQFSKEIFKHKLFKPALIFFGWLLLTLVISFFFYKPIPNLIASLYFVRLLAYFLFFFYFYHHIKQHPKDKSFYENVVLITTSIIIFFSLIQYWLYPNLGNLAYQGWDPHLYRLVGLFFDPPVTASVFFLLGLFLFYSKFHLYLKIGFISVLSILFFLTYSRGGFLAVLVVIALFSLRKMKITYLLAGIAVMVCAYVIMPKNMSEGLNLMRTTSIETRLADYSKAIKIWQRNPLLGIGYNHIRFEKDSYEADVITEKYNPSHASSSFHSSFLIILATSGVVGLLLYLYLLGWLANSNGFAFYSVIFLSVYSLTDNVLLHPFMLFLLFFLIPLIHPSDKSL